MNYTQAQMDEVINSARAHNAFMAKSMAENEAQIVKLLQSMREHVVAGRKDRALSLIDCLIEVNSIK